MYHSVAFGLLVSLPMLRMLFCVFLAGLVNKFSLFGR